MSEHIQNALSGDFIEIAHVTDTGTTEETEQIVSNTTGDVSITKDAEELETSPHSQRRTFRFRTNDSVDVEFEAINTPDLEHLEDVGVFDQAGDAIYGETWETMRLYVYDKSPRELADGDEAQNVIELDLFDPTWDEITYPENDVATVSYSGFVNGEARIGKSE